MNFQQSLVWAPSLASVKGSELWAPILKVVYDAVVTGLFVGIQN